MQLYILDSNYDQIATINEAESILWHKKFNDVGECEIYLPCSAEMLEVLRIGNYVFRYDDDMFCQIKKVEIETDVENGDYIIATAMDMCNVLAGRIVRWQVVYSGTVAGFIRKLLIDNVINPSEATRRIPNFEIDTSNFAQLTETIEVSAVTNDLLQLIIATCKTYNYGFRVSYSINTQKLVFGLYKGKNKALPLGDEYVEFSPTYANILSSNYKEDSSNHKNVAYVGYKDEAEKMVVMSVYYGAEPTGENRKEIYVDGTSTSRDIQYEELLALFPNVKKGSENYYLPDDGTKVAAYKVEGDTEKITVTDFTYLKLIQLLGENALAQHISTQEFSGAVDTIDTYEYKTDYNLGDVVNVVNDYGISATARIVEVMESEDNEDGLVIEPKFQY